VRQSLQQRTQVTLGELLATRPLQQGLAELVAYFTLASDAPDAATGLRAAIDDAVQEQVSWVAPEGRRKSARLPRVIFSR
jgi:hypothetical protein